MPLQTYAYPTPGEFRELEKEYEPDLMADPIFRHFPIRSRNTWRVRWRQKDNYFGLQQARGLNGEPPRVVPVGENWFESVPGVYGEYMPIDEQSLTTRADTPMNASGLPMPTEDQVDECQEQLLVRRQARIVTTLWQLAVQGYFVVRNQQGAVVHTDSYTQQVYTGSDWSTAATATPLADFRGVGAFELGTSNSFGSGAVAYMNRTTAQRMMNNTNASDLGGKRGTGGGTISGIGGWNTILQADGAPRVEVYNQGYYDDNGAFQLLIPDDKVVVIGTRPGAANVGEYQMVINANNPNRAPGPYTIVKDSADGPHPVPRQIAVHDGHNGGPTVEYPSLIVLMNV